jgi:hypothetical protein
MITLIYAVYAVRVAVSLFLAGHLSDIHGRRPLLLAALGMDAASAIVATLGGFGVGALVVGLLAQYVAHPLTVPSRRHRTRHDLAPHLARTRRRGHRVAPRGVSLLAARRACPLAADRPGPVLPCMIGPSAASRLPVPPDCWPTGRTPIRQSPKPPTGGSQRPPRRSTDIGRSSSHAGKCAPNPRVFSPFAARRIRWPGSMSSGVASAAAIRPAVIVHHLP